MTRRQKWALFGAIVLLGCGGAVAAVVTTRSGAIASDDKGQPLNCIDTLALSSTLTCVLFKNGRAQCHGRSTLLGRPYRHPDPDPEPVRTDVRFSKIRPAYDAVCGLSRADGSVWCWGSRTGAGAKANEENLPLELEVLGRGNQDLGVADDRICVLKPDSSVWCQQRRGGPAEKVMDGARSLDMHHHHGCSRMKSGDVECWGVNQNGELGRGTVNDDGSFTWLSPAPVLPPARSFETLRVGGVTVCGLTKERDIWCWGSNSDSQFADGRYASGEEKLTYPAPKKLELGLAIRDYVPSCVLSVDGRVFCWGPAGYGEMLGEPSVRFTRDGALVMLEPKPRELEALGSDNLRIWGEGHHCVQKQDLSVWCWGANLNQQIDAALKEPEAPLTRLPITCPPP